MTRQQLANDLRAQIADDPVSFEFDGALFIGAWSGINLSRPLEIGGFDPQPVSVIMVPLLDQFGNPTFDVRPTIGKVITVGIHSFRIVSTEIDSMSSSMQLNLEQT